MATETEFAPAKVNLTLHVTGRRKDGYHLLDSLVVFAGVGDKVTVTPGEGLDVTGPQATHLPPGDDNLCLRAARAMGGGVHIRLEKVLPVASGIGGGSADAAATLRAMERLGRTMPGAGDVLALGADVPVCLAGHAVRMSGTGEQLRRQLLPAGWLVLANPRVPVSTAEVFRRLQQPDNAPMPASLPALPRISDLAAFLSATRNDLEPAALSLAPAIAQVKGAIATQPGCLFARMSGSGATCFGLFPDAQTASAAQRALTMSKPGWWVAAAPMIV